MLRNVVQRSLSTAVRLRKPQGPEVSTLEPMKASTPATQVHDPYAELFDATCEELKKDIEDAYKRVHAECVGIDGIINDTWFLQWHERRKYENLNDKTASYLSKLEAQNCKYQKSMKKYNT